MAEATSVDLEGLAAHVDEAMQAVRRLDQPARETAERLQTAIEAFHREALVTIVRRLKNDTQGKPILMELVDDAAVRAVFALHGIIRLDAPPPPEPPKDLVQLRRRRDGWDKSGWVSGPPADSVGTLRPTRFDVGERSFILVWHANALHAFRNECAHRGMPLDSAHIDADGTLTCPWHGYRFDVETGACLTTPTCQLEPLGVRIEDGLVWVQAG